MSEERARSFPPPNEREGDYVYIKTEIENAEIEVQRISIDDTITTDKEVPEEIKSRLREYAADKGINLTFVTSE